MMKALNFLLGFVAGAILASSLVSLLTPSSGTELRGQVKNYVDSMKEEVRKAGEARRGELQHQLETLRKPTNS